MRCGSACVGVSMISQSRVSKDRRIERPAAQTRRGACIALISAMLLTAVPHGGARAADWLDHSLRGSFSPSSSVRWDGINLGVQASLTSMDTGSERQPGQQVAYILRNSTLETKLILLAGRRCRISPTAATMAASSVTARNTINSCSGSTRPTIGCLRRKHRPAIR